MKKNLKQTLYLVTLAMSVFSGSKALAKTQGSYAGVDLLRTKAEHKYKQSGLINFSSSKFDDSAFGYGVNYKYALNFNGLFLAPVVFYENLNTESKDSDNDSVSLKNRYGAKLELGYDFSDEFALYVSGGVAKVSYEVDWSSVNRKKTGNDTAAIIGVGILFYPAKNLALNLDYNIQKLTLGAPTSGGGLIRTEVDTDVSVIKFGVSYHF